MLLLIGNDAPLGPAMDAPTDRVNFSRHSM